MYYTVEEKILAIDKAKEIINNRTMEVDKYTLGYNDCWALITEYDKALRQKEFTLFDFDYRDSMDFLRKLNKLGFKTFEDLAKQSDYEIVTNTRPQYGDIAFEFLRNKIGTAMIASSGWWVSTCEFNTGTVDKRKIKYKESLNILARPIKRN